MKIETEEIFVLTKAKVGGTKIGESRASCCRSEGAARQEVEKKRTAETEVQCCGLEG